MGFPRVELHIHLDGALRHATIWELSKRKNLPLPGCGTLQELISACIITQPKDLQHFLSPFGIFIPTIQDDLCAAERIAYEFCEDMATTGAVYVEARYSPHNFLSPDRYLACGMDGLKAVVSAITRGFERGYEEFGVKVRSILCALSGMNTIEDIFTLARVLHCEGVVGIDLASPAIQGQNYVEVPLNEKELHYFEEARKCGIHRTVHAGESGGPEMVTRALDKYHAERIGHGYHVLQDATLYARCVKDCTHFECCPWSSFLTGAVPMTTQTHPIVRFLEDGASFSLNSDDPTVTGRLVLEDYKLAAAWGFTQRQMNNINLDAAKASFLPDDEKKDLIQSLLKSFGTQI